MSNYAETSPSDIISKRIPIWLLNNNIAEKYKFGFNHKFSILNVSFIKSSPSSWNN